MYVIRGLFLTMKVVGNILKSSIAINSSWVSQSKNGNVCYVTVGTLKVKGSDGIYSRGLIFLEV